MDTVIPKDLFRPVRLSNENPIDFERHVSVREATGSIEMLAPTPQYDDGDDYAEITYEKSYPDGLDSNRRLMEYIKDEYPSNKIEILEEEKKPGLIMQDRDDDVNLSRKPLLADMTEEMDIIRNPFVVNDESALLDESSKPMLNNNFLFSDPDEDD